MAQLNFCIIPYLLLNSFMTPLHSLTVTDGDLHITNETPRTTSSVGKFVPHRYDRYFFFFFSENATLPFFRTMLNEIVEFDNYCGGENLNLAVFFSNVYQGPQRYFMSLDEFFFYAECPKEDIAGPCFQNSVSRSVFSGTVDYKDVASVSNTLLSGAQEILENGFDGSDQTVAVDRQFILITDYAADSLRHPNTTKALNDLKTQQNVTLIALTANLTSGTIEYYFPDNLWNVYPNFTSWTPDHMANPICDYKTHHYTTPNPLFYGNLTLNVYSFFSFNYTNGTRLVDVEKLLSQLITRRWLYPCNQYRAIILNLYIPVNGTWESQQCVADDVDIDDEHYLTPFCPKYFSKWITSFMQNDNTQLTCGGHYNPFFVQFVTDNTFVKNKYLLITDLPLSCTKDANFVTDVLSNYSDYKTGAPLTLIAIDKVNENSVAKSYERLFPVTQLPNLYQVSNLSELLLHINTTINFCLNSAPFLNLMKLPYHGPIWYFILIGSAFLTAFVSGFAIVIYRRKKKRREELKKIGERMQRAVTTLATTSMMSMSHEYEYNSPPKIVDIWEVPLKSLDIRSKALIGKGAFSIVHAGFLQGRAPVLDVYPSVALQDYVDCDVAVKTLPQHCKETDKALFRSEIRLMKDIGYHVHLVSMLGCNCSIARPLLIMELAEQSLLQWLIYSSTSIIDTETSLEKTLLSISWQNYLSSRNFVHRDLAARNILLNKDMKAMKLERAEQVVTLSGGKLPLKWMALESLQDQQFSSKTDVWSFGVLLYEIFTLGQEPYLRLSGEELLTFLKDGNRLDQPKLSNEQMYAFMRHCWMVDPGQRPDFTRIQAILEGMLEDSVAHYGYLLTAENGNSDISDKLD